MPVQDLSLLLADKISNRKIFSKFKQIKDFYNKNLEERQKIVDERLTRTLKNAYESIPFYYELAESNQLREVFLNFDNNLDQIPTINKKTLIDNKRFLIFFCKICFLALFPIACYKHQWIHQILIL